MIIVHVRGGTLATGTGHRTRGVSTRWSGDLRTGYQRTQGYYVRDLSGGVQEVRRGCCNIYERFTTLYHGGGLNDCP